MEKRIVSMSKTVKDIIVFEIYKYTEIHIVQIVLQYLS